MGLHDSAGGQMGKVMRVVRRAGLLGIFLLIGVALLGAAGTFIPYSTALDSAGNALRDHRILVVSNTLHTDIAIPLDDEARMTLGFLANTGLPMSHPDAQWLLIGWGGRSFYMETPTLADIKPGPTFRALTLDRSVMHVDVFADIVQDDPSVIPLDITAEGYTNLLWTISESFVRSDSGVVPIEGYAFGTTDRFYEAEGGFNALLGCNVWTSRMLRSAGVTTGLWNPLPSSLKMSLETFNR
jgi:uncharacterized protein (TIGR02117 family)